MGFLPGSLDKSVFNQGTFESAIGKDGRPGYAVVRITPNNARLSMAGGQDQGFDPSIKGVFDFEKGTFGFGVEANWASLGDIGGAILPGATNMVKGVFEKLNAGANLAGAAEVGAGLASQLIYQKSGYLEIKIPMMIVDWNGTGQPVLCALLLSRYCLPSFVLNGKDVVEKGLEKVKEWVEGLDEKDPRKAVYEKISGWGKGASEGIENTFGGIGKSLADKAPDTVKYLNEKTSELAGKVGENIGEIDDAYTLRASPSDVSVEIGQFFVNRKMVITGVNFEFSKEMTRSGPLYVNIDISLKSRRILTSLNDIGLQLPNKNQRFLYAQGGERDSTGL